METAVGDPLPIRIDTQVSDVIPNRAGTAGLNSRGLSGRVAKNMSIRVYFLHRHLRGTLVILDEGKLPHPWFPYSDILVPWVALNGQHTTTTKPARGVEQKWRRMRQRI